LRVSAFPGASALLALAIAAAVAGCSVGASLTGSDQVAANTAPEVQITDTKVGDGISPRPGLICTVNYTGWLYVNGVKGAKFDSSFDRKKPFSFTLGQHGVIEGWERGVGTMKKGGKRTLIIPPELAYGSKGSPPTIPSNATLMFDIELLDVKASS
jgi:peptidylprolyl isomerase